jgi:hypothetical protein
MFLGGAMSLRKSYMERHLLLSLAYPAGSYLAATLRWEPIVWLMS